MKWLTDTIAGRTLLVLLVGIGGVLLLANTLYQLGSVQEQKSRDAARLADRLLVLKEAITRLPAGERDEAAHALSGGPIEVHWSDKPLASPGGTPDPFVVDLKKRLLGHAPDLDESRLILGSSPDVATRHPGRSSSDQHHTTLISLALDDASWINVSVVTLDGPGLSSPSFWISMFAMLVGSAAVSMLMARWLTGPLQSLTDATHTLFAKSGRNPVPEAGTREVKALGSAINALQQRIERLLQDRTLMLAAVSHDLHTPLTRLRLRLEELPEDATKSSFEADLNEMQEMLDATLSFLKGEVEDEPTQTLDLVAVIETIANDMTDAAADVRVEGLRHAVLDGRRLALKRAMTNIMQNAVKYGGSARISIRDAGAQYEVFVEDGGPGIPEKDQEAAFTPFLRLEASRSKGTGGYGLGLSVARSIIRAHGGDIILRNLVPKGLQANVTLPKVGGGS